MGQSKISYKEVFFRKTVICFKHPMTERVNPGKEINSPASHFAVNLLHVPYNTQK